MPLAKNLQKLSQDGHCPMMKVSFFCYEVVAMAHNLRCEITSYDIADNQEGMSSQAYKDARSKFETYTQDKYAFVGLRDSDGWICKK